MTVIIEEEVNVDLPFDYKEVASCVIEGTLDYEGFPYEAQVSLTITGLDEIHEINREYRQIDAPTDVLSFPLVDYSKAGDFSVFDQSDDCFDPDTGEAMLGDIVLCLPRIYSQAEEYGHSVLREYGFLIAHSMLHLLGYDHMEEEERAIMEEKQSAILDRLNIKREV